ncbi:lysosomal amino acid transporter 1 homolog isoform X2 [Ipomoea triloba]|uniref:lysosomal amino acid transporter 1 homolog isoform X2 n=1 Tax=Ipomoea triloba TaxID=35885 RepID=UPI00125CF051|nr:lysosomal amino acid transporter 1 homolog isoform X2 [Ipomoea triloba]
MEKWWLKMAENTAAAAYCVREEKGCVGWVYKHFNDCLCNVRDEVSFCLGLASFVCWGVAEIPQIFTNFRTKSSHGISLLFLLTWITGDIFNLVGCLLEPATLPTQLYTALLYTATTLVLVLQTLYYDYVYKSWKCKAEGSNHRIEDVKKPLWPPKSVVSGVPIPNDSARTGPQHRIDYYYTSARSLAGSATPPFRSSLWPIKSGPSALGIQDNDASSDDDEAAKNYSFTQIKGIPRSAGYGAFLATTVNTPRQAKALMSTYVAFGGRKLLQEDGAEHGASGQWLGWMMAAIYLSSRLPQIWLNIRRGSAEGLNPFMFIFALIANLTYVGSIVVRTTEWDKIEPNLPWLFDAAGCVMLDLLIILQYIYYRYFRKKASGEILKGMETTLK